MAALAVGRVVEQAIQAGGQTITAADPIPDDALHALNQLRAATTH